MTVPFVDLAAQYQSIRREIDEALAAVMADSAFIGNQSNDYVRRFEQEFAEFVGVEHAIACANGTDAIEILLKACGVKAGDEVIVPAMTWIATSEAVTNIGGRPVFVDIDSATYTIDPGKIERAITDLTRAIIPVHLYGMAAEMDPILDLATHYDLTVIEDCAQAHGARYKGRSVGTMGRAASFSFFPGKNLGAYGDAGGMVTNDPDIAIRAKMISQHGQAGAKHDHRVEGRNSRMDGMQAAVLSVKLQHLPEWTETRRRLARRYDELLAPCGLQRQYVPADRYHVYHLYTIRVSDRERVQSRLLAAGIQTGVQYPKALPTLTAYADWADCIDQFPESIGLAASTLSLPIYPEMAQDSIVRVANAVLASV